MDTMKWTKIVGGFCGALLALLLLIWASDVIYTPTAGGHGEAHAMAYPIEVEESGAGPAKEEGPDFMTLLASADPAKGEKIFSKCKACHKLEPGANATGPTLFGVVGRDVASVEGFNYSSALKNLGGKWTPERLNAFLENPKKYAPGTSMGFAGLKKIEDRANLIAYLSTVQ